MSAILNTELSVNLVQIANIESYNTISKKFKYFALLKNFLVNYLCMQVLSACPV